MSFRIILSIKNRIKQTSLLLVVMFVISCLLCLSYSINNASSELINKIKNSTNPKVSIDTDFSVTADKKIYLYDEDKRPSASYSIYENLNKISNDFNIKYIDINMRLSNEGIVKSYSEFNGVLTSIPNHNLYEIENGASIEDHLYGATTQFDMYLNNQIDYWQSYDLVSTRNTYFSDIYYGYSHDGYGESKKTEIKKGRTFTQEEIDSGEYVCVITPDTYYYKDGNLTKVEAGDYIEFSIMVPIDGEVYVYETYEFKVIGVLNQVKLTADKNNQFTNCAIIPEKLFLEIYEKANKINKDNSLEYSNYFLFYPCIITLSNYDEAERLIEYLEDLNKLDNANFRYESSLDSYYAIAGNLEALSENTDILFKFSIVVSILLFIFMINMDLNRRKKEVGLLSSFGEKKIQLIIEFTIQYLVIAFISLILAILVSLFVSKTFLNDLINISSVDSTLMDGKILDYSNSLKIIKNTSVSINIIDALKVCLLEFITIIIITILSMLRIFQIKVREVLIDE